MDIGNLHIDYLKRYTDDDEGFVKLLARQVLSDVPFV